MTLEYKFEKFMLTAEIEHDLDSRWVDLNPFADDAPIRNDDEIPFLEIWLSVPFSFVLALAFHDRCNLAGK